MNTETGRFPQLNLTAGEWINKPGIQLSAWRASQDPSKTGRLSRLNAGGTNKAKALLRRMDMEGKK